jgi:hypothetical protein
LAILYPTTIQDEYTGASSRRGAKVSLVLNLIPSLEALYLACRIDNALFTGEKGMAFTAHLNF